MRVDPSVTKRMIEKYPQQWKDLKDSVRIIKITCQDSKVPKLIAELEGIGLKNSEDYVRPVSDASHSGKFDIIVKVTPKVLSAASVFFLHLNSYKQEPGEAQIANKYVFTRMIQEGKLPRLNSEREESAAA